MFGKLICVHSDNSVSEETVRYQNPDKRFIMTERWVGEVKGFILEGKFLEVKSGCGLSFYYN